MNLNLNLRPWSRAGVVVLATGVIALAGCSSDSTASSSSTSKDTKSSASSSTTKAADTSSTTGATTKCATQDEATAALGTNGTATGAPYCAGNYAAGSATNGQIDFAYLLVYQGGKWEQASDAVQSAVCTTNPDQLPQQLVDDACND